MIDEKDNLPQQNDSTKPKRARSVLIYLIILFAAAIILLLLAFFMQQRNNEAITGLRESLSSFESLDTLIQSNLEQQQQLNELEEQISELEETNSALQSQLDTTNQHYAEINDGYQEYIIYSNALYTLYSAEMKAAEEDYAGATELLSGWAPENLGFALAAYDATLSDQMSGLLPTRYKALLSTLKDAGYFDGEQFLLAAEEG